MAQSVLVVGMGTIGEPLVSLLDETRDSLGIGDIMVYKHTARLEDRPTIAALKRRGALFCVAPDKAQSFRDIGIEPDLIGLETAIERARVIIDTTPEGTGLANKEKYYLRYPGKGYIAQGSEFGFGRPYVAWVNDAALQPSDDYIHVQSCNTHCASAVIRTFACREGHPELEWGRFVCIRRSSDVGRGDKLVPSVRVNGHKGPFGTHHARDVHQVFHTLGHDLKLFSSALQVNTQYMHVLHFHLRLKHPLSQAEAEERIATDPVVSGTNKDMTNLVFAFGRDHSFHGRILSQAVISRPSLAIDGNEVVGYAFVPQDGNVLLSSVMATARFLHPLSMDEKAEYLHRYVLPEV